MLELEISAYDVREFFYVRFLPDYISYCSLVGQHEQLIPTKFKARKAIF